MADSKISGLTNGTPAQLTDVFAIERSSTANFRLTVQDVFNLAATYTFPTFAITAATTNTLTTSGTTTFGSTITVNSSVGSANQILASRGAGLSPQWIDSFPPGGIIMWSGSTIPSGWALCNGASGTPDLRNRFIVGSGSTWSTGSTGGNNDAVVVAHTHTITDPGHHHSYTASAINNAGRSNGGPSTNAGSTTSDTADATTGITINSAGVSATYANMPLYYALAFIMKLAY
jgi:microcystin-dependent protein